MKNVECSLLNSSNLVWIFTYNSEEKSGIHFQEYFSVPNDCIYYLLFAHGDSDAVNPA